MTWYQIACVFGVPSLFAGLYGMIWRLFKQFRAENGALRKAFQALLRDRLVDEYNHYTDKGFAPIYARENFENVWKQYHTLGANGVMDDLHAKFLALPTQKEEEHDNE